MLFRTKQNHCLHFILAILFTISVHAGAQEIVSENGKQYLLHKVEAGQTLYGLSKQYKVSQKDISKANNNLLEGLRYGETIKIPQSVENGQKQLVKYVYHKVRPDDNLSKIAVRYMIPISDILHTNSINKLPQPGKLLKIPKDSFAIVEEKFVGEIESFIYHTVEQGQTLYFLKKKYNVEIDEIRAVNPMLKNSPKIGQLLRIPVPLPFQFDTIRVVHDTVFINPLIPIRDSLVSFGTQKPPCHAFDYKIFRKPFNIAILLPFRVDKNKMYDENEANPELKNRFYGSTEKILELYEGILIAADSLRKTGLELNLFVFDTKADTYELRKILDDDYRMPKMDMIIGPVYGELLGIAANWAQNQGIPLVSPVSQDNNCLVNNPYVFQANPAMDMRIERAATYLARFYDKNIVMLHNSSVKEENLIEIYKQKLARSFEFNSGIEEVVIKEIDCKLRGLDGIEGALSLGMENLVIVPSQDEVFASDIVTKLHTLADTYEIKVFGMANWIEFQNMELDYLRILDATFFTTSFIDYRNHDVKSFIASYRDKFKTEPKEFAYQGYDIMFYFTNALKRYGPDFKECVSPLDFYPNKYGLRGKFEFYKNTEHSGYHNEGVFIVRFNSNYKNEQIDVDENNEYFFKFEWE